MKEYTEKYQESMTDCVRKIAENLTAMPWHNSGRFIVSGDGQLLINIWNYIEEFAEADLNGRLIRSRT